MQISLSGHRCRAAALWASLLMSGAACAGQAQATSQDSGYEFARVTYASDYCTQLRWKRPAVGDAAEDDSDTSSPAPVALTPAATPGADIPRTAPGQDDSADTAEERSDEADADVDAPELLLSSRFNHESCEGAEVGAVVDDNAQLPPLIAALQAVHEALAVQPDWIDDSKLPLDWQGCWRRGARLVDAWGVSDDGSVVLILEIQDCTGQQRPLQLQLQQAGEEQPQGYRRRGGILATMLRIAICGYFVE